MSTLKNIGRRLTEKLVSPRTAALLKLGIAVIGVVSALKDLRDANKENFKFYGDERDD